MSEVTLATGVTDIVWYDSVTRTCTTSTAKQCDCPPTGGLCCISARTHTGC
jgi:hypothetical protein